MPGIAPSTLPAMSGSLPISPSAAAAAAPVSASISPGTSSPMLPSKSGTVAIRFFTSPGSRFPRPLSKPSTPFVTFGSSEGICAITASNMPPMPPAFPARFTSSRMLVPSWTMLRAVPFMLSLAVICTPSMADWKVFTSP